MDRNPPDWLTRAQHDQLADNTDTSPLRSWRASDNGAAQFQGASAYSRFVDIMKTALPFAAVCIVIIVVIYAATSESRNNLSIFPDTGSALSRDVSMVNPEVIGFDNENRPYKMTADFAEQDPDNPNVIRLQTIRGEVETSVEAGQADSGDTVKISADTGILNSLRETMRLNGDVLVVSDSNYRVETQQAIILLKEGRLFGNTAVSVTGPMGEIDADRFEISQNGDRIRFTGRVKTTLFPDGRPES